MNKEAQEAERLIELFRLAGISADQYAKACAAICVKEIGNAIWGISKLTTKIRDEQFNHWNKVLNHINDKL